MLCNTTKLGTPGAECFTMQQCTGRTLQLSAMQQACRHATRPLSRLTAPVQRPRRRLAVYSAAPAAVRPEAEIEDMPAFLDSLKWDSNGLVVAIAQHVDTGEVLMQAFADRNAVLETLQTG